MDLVSPEVAEQIFNECDIDRKGGLTLDDFRSLSQRTENQFTDAETAFIFSQLDLNHDGYVTKEEFIRGFATALNVGETKGFSDMKRRGSLLPVSRTPSAAPSPISIRIDEAADTSPPKNHLEIECDYGKLDILPCQEDLLALYSRLQCLGKPERLKTVSVPDLLTQFEKFIDGVCKELTDQRDQNERLRDMLTKEKRRHDQQIDEVETSLTTTLTEAKAKAKLEERDKFEREKDELCQQFESELTELKSTIASLQKSVYDEENAKYEKSEEIRQKMQELSKENMRLRHNLAEKQTELVIIQATMARLRRELDDKLSDWTTEKEQLIRFSDKVNSQLQILYEANKQLQDTNDHLRSALEARMVSSRQISVRTPSPVSTGRSSPSRQIAGDMNSSGQHLLHVRRPMAVWMKGPEDSMETDEDLDSGLFTRGSNTTCSGDSAEDDLRRRIDYESAHRNSLEYPTALIQAVPARIVRNDSVSSAGTVPRSRLSTVDSKHSFRVYQSTEPLGPPERTFRVVMVGDAAVGKTTLITRIVKGEFQPYPAATIGVEYRSKSLRVDGRNVALQLWDTAGQEKFRSLCKTYFRRADGAILAYDSTCEQSFLNVRYWLDAVQENVNRKIPVLLCANKIDLRAAATANGQRCVSNEEGENLAKTHGIQFIETSAKEGTNANEAILTLTKELLTVQDTYIRSTCIALDQQKKKSGCKTCRGS